VLPLTTAGVVAVRAAPALEAVDLQQRRAGASRQRLARRNLHRLVRRAKQALLTGDTP
jgi:hypothetical protein